jgi:hypothetical protein
MRLTVAVAILVLVGAEECCCVWEEVSGLSRLAKPDEALEDCM